MGDDCIIYYNILNECTVSIEYFGIHNFFQYLLDIVLLSFQQNSDELQKV